MSTYKDAGDSYNDAKEDWKKGNFLRLFVSLGIIFFVVFGPHLFSKEKVQTNYNQSMQNSSGSVQIAGDVNAPVNINTKTPKVGSEITKQSFKGEDSFYHTEFLVSLAFTDPDQLNKRYTWASTLECRELPQPQARGRGVYIAGKLEGMFFGSKNYLLECISKEVIKSADGIFSYKEI